MKKKISKRDIIILCIVFIFGISTKSLYDYINGLNVKDYSLENLQLVKQMDSLILVIYQRDNQISSRDTVISKMKLRQLQTDSLIVKNHEKLKNDKEKVKVFTPDSRNKYVDSLLKSAGVRK
jgi:hypothetical protein